MSARTAFRRGGFTLIEVLAVLFLTALVLGVALDFFVDLSNESAHASDSTRELRRATGLVDRIANDVERAVLVKKPKEMDPLAHPWLFLAEPRVASEGSDRIKFIERAEPPSGDQAIASDTAVVAYTLEPHADGTPGYALRRWSSPQLPDRLDRDFPRADDPDSLVLADGIASFEMRFLGDDGQWVDRWDSSQIVESGALPQAVEIEVALVPDKLVDDTGVAVEPMPYVRRVLLPMRPLDIEKLTDPKAQGSGDDDENCIKVSECVDFSQVGGGDETPLPPGSPGLTPDAAKGLMDLVNNAPNLCWSQFKAIFGNHKSVKPECR